LKILVVELEPTHYKIDLWNAFVESSGAELTVVYSERKNWSPDGGHDYQQFPPALFKYLILEGKGLLGVLRSSLQVLSINRKVSPELTYIAGYVHLQTVLTILYSVLLGRRFVVHADVFNNCYPKGRMALLKLALREALRKLVFRYADAVLVCGRLGEQTAFKAGCPQNKIRNFPYSISVSRIRGDKPDNIPEQCIVDMDLGKIVILFSGRMIERKGLPTLLEAMKKVTCDADWILWIEGDGPELKHFSLKADDFGIAARCRFLGFCQYDLHSWLVRSADIIVVPSFEDSWGILVDEGLQLGKAVVSTSATGSAVDRIVEGENGFIVSPGDSESLAFRLSDLLASRDLRERIGNSAVLMSRHVLPKDNVETLMNLRGKS